MAEPLKNSIGPEIVEALAGRLDVVGRDVHSADLRAAAGALGDLELKDRINLIADAIAAGGPYLNVLDAVVAVAADESLDMWAVWPLCSVIERHGVDHPTESLAAMEEVTKRFSCEFAIRPFLEHHLDQTFDALDRWSTHEHEGPRRLVSEGTRPYLPWGPRVAALTESPERAIALLDRLRHDPSEVVRRSVANHLNDVAKFDPDLVIATLGRWSDEDPAPNPSMVRHALRTLVKAGNPGAMELLGFTTNPNVEVETFSCDPASIELGQSIELTATIRSTAASKKQKLVVDFVIHHVKANGETAPKVFKWTTLDLGPSEVVTLTKSRPVKPISTRVYYSGHHPIELQIAGQAVAATGFNLEVG